MYVLMMVWVSCQTSAQIFSETLYDVSIFKADVIFIPPANEVQGGI